MANINKRDGTIKGKTFTEWKAEVNSKILAKTGMISDDIGDWDYYSAWRDGMGPASAASKAIASAKNS
jgi:hypothetical protein